MLTLRGQDNYCYLRASLVVTFYILEQSVSVVEITYNGSWQNLLQTKLAKKKSFTYNPGKKPWTSPFPFSMLFPLQNMFHSNNNYNKTTLSQHWEGERGVSKLVDPDCSLFKISMYNKPQIHKKKIYTPTASYVHHFRSVQGPSPPFPMAFISTRSGEAWIKTDKL